MEFEGSLPQSQVPATCPYSEPARSSPYPPFWTTQLEYDHNKLSMFIQHIKFRWRKICTSLLVGCG